MICSHFWWKLKYVNISICWILQSPNMTEFLMKFVICWNFWNSSMLETLMLEIPVCWNFENSDNPEFLKFQYIRNSDILESSNTSKSLICWNFWNSRMWEVPMCHNFPNTIMSKFLIHGNFQTSDMFGILICWNFQSINTLEFMELQYIEISKILICRNFWYYDILEFPQWFQCVGIPENLMFLGILICVTFWNSDTSKVFEILTLQNFQDIEFSDRNSNT